MMNIGSDLFQTGEFVTSIGWRLDNKVTYVAEGNINYAGAVINWLVDDLKLLSSPKKAETCALSAENKDQTYLVPAFSGLGAPYCKPNAAASLTGMTRTTGRNEN